jgi:CheY-like chemotaxis protein
MKVRLFSDTIRLATFLEFAGLGKRLMFVVVVAEDEPLILMEIVDQLIEEGFEVLEARHAAEALDILAASAPDVHVLFTDVRMRGEMDGVALSHHVKTHWPWIGLLVTSAHATPMTDNLPEGCRFLPKPYHHAHVMQHLRALTAAA